MGQWAPQALSTQLTLSDGRLGAYSRCVVAVNVQGTTLGTQTVSVGPLTSSLGNSGTATADLTVDAGLTSPGLSVSPSTVAFGGVTRATYTLDNTQNGNIAYNPSLTHELPPGVKVAAPSRASTDCVNLVVTAAPGDDVVTAGPSGLVTLGAGSTCTVSVDLEVASVGVIELVTEPLSVLDSGTFLTVQTGIATTTLTVPAETVTLQVALSDSQVPPGGVTTLRATLTNRHRTEAATDLAFSLDLDGALSGLRATGLPGSTACGSGSSVSGDSVVAFSGGALPPDSSCAFDIELTVPPQAGNGDYLLSTTPLAATVAQASRMGSAASRTLQVAYAPQLEVSTAGPAAPGQPTTLTFEVTNTAPSTAMTDMTFLADLGAFLSGATITPPPSGFCGPSALMSTYQSGGRTLLQILNASLVAGASCTFDVTLQVPETAAAGGHLLAPDSFFGTLNGTEVPGDMPPFVLDVLGAPRLILDGPAASVETGGAVPLTFTLSLPDEVVDDATNIGFSLDLDSAISGLVGTGLPLADACGVGSEVSGTSVLTLTGASLQPGGSCSFTVPAQLPAGAAAGMFALTTSSVAFTSRGVSGVGSAASTALEVAGALQLSVTPQPATPVQGGTVDLVYTIEHVGTATDATAIAFNHEQQELQGLTPTNLPLSDVCGTGSQVVTNNGGVEFSAGTLTPGTQCSFSMTFDVPVDAHLDSLPLRTDLLQASLGGSNQAFPAAQTIIEVREPLNLAAIFASASARLSAPAATTFTITNADASHAVEEVAFSVDLAAALPGLTATALTRNDACGVGSTLTAAGGTITFTGGSLGAGGTCSLAVELQMPAVAPPDSALTLTTSRVTGRNRDAATISGDAASARLAIHQVSVGVRLLGQAVAGQLATLAVDVENLNPGAALEGVRVTLALDDLLTGLTSSGLPRSDVCGEGSQLSGARTLALSEARLDAGSTCSFEVQVRIPDDALPGDYSGSTGAPASSGQPVGGGSLVDLTVTAVPPSLTRTLDPNPLQVGQTGTLLYTIDNSRGNTAVGSLVFSDSLPSNIALSDPTGASTDCGRGALITAQAGGATVELQDGVVNARSSCDVWVDVVGVTVGSEDWPGLPLSSDVGATEAPAGTVDVTPGPPVDAGMDDAGMDDAGMDDAGMGGGTMEPPAPDGGSAPEGPPMDAGCVDGLCIDAGEGGCANGLCMDAGVQSGRSDDGCGCRVVGTATGRSAAPGLGAVGLLLTLLTVRTRRRARREVKR